jgi:nucleoside-diphosphate-sugar epimerase
MVSEGRNGSEARPARVQRRELVNAPGVIAITGLRTFVGKTLVERLLERMPGVRIVGLDRTRPFRLDDRVRFHRVDLTEPTADGPLSEILANERVDVLVHAAFRTDPTLTSSRTTISRPSAACT